MPKDTPEYFWEEDAWEPAYEALCAYLDIPLRVDNLNKRLVSGQQSEPRVRWSCAIDRDGGSFVDETVAYRRRV